MLTAQERLISNHLSQFVSAHKKQFIDKVLGVRTRHLTIVIEDIFQSQNASAVLRTCECMGIQDIHIVEQRTKYNINPRVLKGSHKWLTLVQYQSKQVHNTEACFKRLHDEGYKILVTDPGEDGISIGDVAITESKIALVFGNELRGVSKYALEHGDRKIRIPMHGFTESLNISVSAAICLNTLVPKLHQQENLFITEEEKETLKLEWYRKIVRRSDLIEHEFLRTIE